MKNMHTHQRILLFCLGCLLLGIGKGFGQNNLTLKLDSASVLLDRIVVCGEGDEQKVIFAIEGNDPTPRTNVQAAVQLFKGIQFDSFNEGASTPGIVLLDTSNSGRPIFSFPDLDPNNLTELELVFSVKTDCAILDTLAGGNGVQVFDNWLVNYQLNGIALTESFQGIEYKDALAIPNLNIFLEESLGPIRVGEELSRQVTVTNSGLNSYVDSFVYQIVMEPGVVYKSLIVNGLAISFSKDISLEGDSIVFAKIGGNLFINNTTEFNLPGNGDDRFDVDEVIAIQEVIEITSCGKDGDSNLASEHQANWGCNEVVCREESRQAVINIGIGEELIQFEQNDTVDAGYCEEGSVSITIANNGFEFDDGFGTIRDISAGIGFAIGTQFLSADQGYQITALRIAGAVNVNAPNGLVNLGNHPSFRTDPDGAGGLEDFDGDGFFDDLKIGESFEIIATYSIDCTQGTTFDIESECDNDFRASFDGKISYTNSCGAGNETLFDNFYRSSNTGDTKEVCTDPDAFNDGDEFIISYTGERRVANFERSCAGADEIRVKVTTLDGIVVSPKTNLQQDTFNYAPISQTGNGEITLTFDAAPISLNNDYVLNLVFETQCAAFGPTSFPVEIEYYCPNCDCRHLWFCGILEGAVLHSSGLPCSDFSCETGLQTTNFEAERITFGYTDTTFSIPFNPENANRKVALTCDSVVMKMTSIVGNQALSDSLGLIITYGNANEQDSEEESFLFSNANILITSGASTRECTLDASDFRLEKTGNQKEMYFRLDDCLSGITLSSGDQIDFIGYFGINSDGPVPTNTFKKVPEFRAKAYAIVDGIVHDNCDSYGELFRLGKLNTVFSGPDNGSYPEGCAPTALVYTLTKSINANAMREFFGEEHRQAVRVEAIQFTYDSALLTAFSDLSVEYKTQTSDWMALPDFDPMANGIYTTSFDFLNTLSTITGTNQVFQTRINLIPGCSAEFGSALGNDLYEIEAKIDYKDRYYANFIGDQTCVVNKEEFDERLFKYDHPPEFSLEALLQEVETAEETVQWIIEHCNTSFLADAGISWLALEEIVGEVDILMIENISVSDAIDTLEIRPYGTEGKQVFAFAAGLNKRTANADPEAICNVFRITARIKNCGTSSVAARVGWECAEYDTPNWTPDLYPPCEEQSILLQASTLDPLLSASFLEDESNISGVLCDTSTMVLIVRNEEKGNAYDIRSQIILPKGASLVSGSIEFAYPSTAPFASIAMDPGFLENSDLGKVYQYKDFALLSDFLHQNGLPGFDINEPDSSEFKIKYRFITNCDYENGELNRYSFQGLSACGDSTNNAFAETHPIIFEADPGLARIFDIQLRAEEVLRTGGVSTLEVQVQNVGNNISEVDKLEVELPLGFAYSENSTISSSPEDWVPGEPIIKSNGEVGVLNWLLPPGLESGESAILQFQVNIGDLPCDSAFTTKIATTSSVEFICMVDGEACVYDFSSSKEEIFPLNTTCEDTSCIIKIGMESVHVVVPDCDSTLYYCLEQYTPEELAYYTILDNGIVVDSSRFGKCNFQQVCIYTYVHLLGLPGPIQVDSWTVNGVTYSGMAANLEELVDSMNVWDQGGNWIILPESTVFQGGHVGGAYSQMEITFPTTGIRSILGYDTRLTPRGVSIFLNGGFHQLLIADSLGCVDTINVEVLTQSCPVCTPPIVQNMIIENSNCGQETGVGIININDDPTNYTYQWVPDVGQPGLTENIRTNLPAGSYLIRITNKLENECFLDVNLVIGNSDGPKAEVSTTPATCTTADGTAQLSPLNFTYNWSDGRTGFSRTDLPAGTYSVTFSDPALPDCVNVMAVEIASNNNLIVTHTVNQEPGCFDNDGSVTIHASGGSDNYTYSFPDGTATRTGLTGGTYFVTVTDLSTGCELPYFFVLNNQTHQGAVNVLNTQAVSCAGASDGAIEFDIIYEDGFRFPVDTLITDGNRHYENNALPIGKYQLYLMDGRGCIAGSADFEITGARPLAVNISKSGDCAATQSVSLEVSGGIADYSFDWADLEGIDNNKDRTELLGGIYQMTITDAANCTVPVTITLEECPCTSATILDTTIIAAACGQANGAVAIELAQDITDYTFIYQPNLGTEGVSKNRRVDLPPGNYQINIIYQEDTACATQISAVVPENPPELVITNGTIKTPADCGLANGSATILIDENPTNYDFIWTPDFGTTGTENNIRNDLPAGDYVVLIAPDGDIQCGTEVLVSIEENAFNENLITNILITPANCGLANGQVVLSIDGNVEDYFFDWPNNAGTSGINSNSRTNLSAGLYEVTVAAAADLSCFTILRVNVSSEDLASSPIVNTQIDPATCGTANGRATILLSEPIADYTFEWTPNAGVFGDSASIRTDLPPGDYEVLVQKGSDPDCAFGLNITIQNEDTLLATVATTPSVCNEPPTGTVTLFPAGYVYTWSDGFVGSTRDSLFASVYEIGFIDPNNPNCIGNILATVEEINSLTTELLVNTLPGCGLANGSVTINVNGGSGDYSYSWDSETDTNNGLAAGEYQVEIIDEAVGCLLVVHFSLEEPEASEALVTITDTMQASCIGTMDGAIQFTVEAAEGFNFPMDTLIISGEDEFENGALPEGNYCLEIRDANDCIAGQACFTIQSSEPIHLSFETTKACADTGTIDLSILGGTAPYQINWLDMEGGDNPEDRIGVDSGFYQVVIIDNKGCRDSATVRVEPCADCHLPTITSIATTPTKCTGNTGSIFIQIEEDVRDYDFIYDPPEGQPFVTGNIRASLAKGLYMVQIISKINPACVLEVEVMVEEKNFDDLVPITTASKCGFQNGTALLLPATNRYEWEDGFTGNNREDLGGGFYKITVTDEEFECVTEIEIEIEEINLLQSKVAILNAPTCGNSDGSVKISLNGGSGDYSFSWDAFGDTKDNLASGSYNVLVTDNQTGCVLPVLFTLMDTDGPLISIEITDTLHASCPLTPDGSVLFTTNLENVTENKLDTIISNGLTYFQNGRLPKGDYCLFIADTLGCVLGQTCFEINAPDALEVDLETIPECMEGGSITIAVSGGVAPYTYTWSDLEASANESIRTNLPNGIYHLTVTDANLCEMVFDAILIDSCEACPLQIGTDTIVIQVANCADITTICLDYIIDPISPVDIMLDGQALEITNDNFCGFDTIITYSYATLFGQGRLGPYTITSWPVNDQVFTGSFNSIEALLDSMNVWDPMGNWHFSEAGAFIEGGAPGSQYQQMDASVELVPVTSFLSYDFRIERRGVSSTLEVGYHEVTIQDPKTFCTDTLIYLIVCTMVDTMEVITSPEHMDTFCLSTEELIGNLDHLTIDCVDENLVEVTIYEDSCIIIKGQGVGNDTVCVVTCDDLGICDTTYFEIDINYEEIKDTMEVQSSNTFCMDTMGLTLEGAIVSMTEICQSDSMNLVDFEFNVEEACITYTGNILGVDQACVQVCDDLGLCDTVEFTITVRNSPPDQVKDTIFINETVVYCFDPSIFPGEIVFFENVCPENSGRSVDFFLDPLNYCVEYSGVDIGKDSACIVLCDDRGNCDSAFFSVAVVEFFGLPHAVDDVDTTDKGVPIVLNVKENDIPFGVPDDGMFIVDQPLYGEVFLNLDGSITYFGETFCERTDQFSYGLCNDVGCDTATVSIYIDCIDIVVFTAVSPNRDGINDVFFISGVEEFPNSILTIYNRWGNVVYKTQNYKNDWTGTWKGNQELPDGTYFYQLELNEENDQRTFQGFFELHR